MLGLQLRGCYALVLLLVFGRGLEDYKVLGVRSGNSPDRVPSDLAAVLRLEYPGWVYFDLQPRELPLANGRKPEGCPSLFV
ncbi:MAG: hypothetical protein AB2556_26700, partial [Candidatus Thiodiazotropha sp.]